jgi:tRNA1Val (adenine37-N6)-methyltransferase
MFTYQYKQPSEYQFSLDSIELARYVAQNFAVNTDPAALRVLDLCAGCGVIGIELSWFRRELRQIDFIEVQDIYTRYFQENKAIVNRPELKLGWHILNYDTLLEKNWEAQFNLIVSNPPYFQPNQGMLSPSIFKSRCRFFLDSTFENYILALANSLASSGEAYFLLRPLKQHNCDLFFDAENLLKNTAVSIQKVAQIRGTDIILMKKP